MKSQVALEHSGRLLNEQQVAEQLGMSVAWVRKRRLQREPPISLRLGTAVRYRASDVEAFLDSLAAPVEKGGE